MKILFGFPAARGHARHGRARVRSSHRGRIEHGSQALGIDLHPRALEELPVGVVAGQREDEVVPISIRVPSLRLRAIECL